MPAQAQDQAESDDSALNSQLSLPPDQRRWQILDRLGIVFLALFLLCAGLFIWHQVRTLLVSNRRVTGLAATQVVYSTPPLTTTLHLRVEGPAILNFDTAATSPQPLTVWLSLYSPNAPLITYTVILSGNVAFVDSDGVATAPRLTIPVSGPVPQPGIIYLQQSPQAEALWFTFWAQPTPLLAQVETSDTNAALQQPLGSELTISRQPAGQAVAWLLVSLLLGPTLLGVFITVGYRLWDQWNEQQETERQRQRKTIQAEQARQIAQIQQRLNSLAEVAEFDAGEAARRWWECNRQRQQDKLWAQEISQEQLDDIWRKDIASRPWQQSLIRQMLDYLKQTQPDNARELAQVIRQQSEATANEPVITAADLLIRLSAAPPSATNEQAGLNLNDPAATELILDALVWLRHEVGLELLPHVAPLTKPLARNTHLPELIATRPELASILYELGLAGELMQRLEQPEVMAAEKKTAQTLLARITGYNLPPELAIAPVTEARPIAVWLKNVGLAHNPFGPERAENDPYLTDYAFYPRPALEPMTGFLRGQQPAILFGQTGSGKTAAARLLLNDCLDPPVKPRESGAFPVYHALNLTPARPSLPEELALSAICRGVAQETLRFLAYNPTAFFEYRPAGQAAITRLLLQNSGSLDNLLLDFQQASLSADGAGQQLLAAISQLARRQSLPAQWLATHCREALAHARPPRLTATYLLLDIHTWGDHFWESRAAAASMQALLQQAPALAAANVYLKVFAPEAMRPYLRLPHAVVSGEITWDTAKLAELLSRHITHASPAQKTGGGLDTFDQLFDVRTIPAGESPTQTLVTAAQNSPRRLMSLGNQVLRQHMIDRPDVIKLSFDTLTTVINEHKP